MVMDMGSCKRRIHPDELLGVNIGSKHGSVAGMDDNLGMNVCHPAEPAMEARHLSRLPTRVAAQKWICASCPPEDKTDGLFSYVVQ